MIGRAWQGFLVVGGLTLIPLSAECQGSFRWYFSKIVQNDTIGLSPADSAAVVGRRGDTLTVLQSVAGSRNRFARRTVVKNNRLWLGPSVGFDVFVREGETGSYRTGIIPGVGYGIKWAGEAKAAGTTPKSLFALDLFVQGALSEEDDSHDGADYFNIDVLPVITVFDWVSVGYGLRYKSGLDGMPTAQRSLFSFGIRKAT